MYRAITKGSKYVDLLKKRSDLQPGKAHIAIRYSDYTCESATFANVVRAAAEQRNLAVTVATFEDAVVYVFFDPYGYWKPYLKNFPVVQKMRRTDAI